MYIHTSVFVSFETSTTHPVSTQGLLTLSNIQHGVRIEAVFASLQQGKHTDQIQHFLHTSSHPDKKNTCKENYFQRGGER